MLTHAALLVGLAQRLLLAVPPGAPARLTVSIESDGRIAFLAPSGRLSAAALAQAAPGDGLTPWPELLRACARWSLRCADGAVRVEARGTSEGVGSWSETPAALDATDLRFELVPDAGALEGRLDEPETLHALRRLAAERRDATFILKLPPEHVGRRW